MTRAEATLWKYVLSDRKLQGYQIRRQRPIMNFIVDFMCKDLTSVIEVDGHTHTYEKVAASDKIRQEKIEEAGFEVIRFEDDEVLNHLNKVKEYLELWIKNNKNPPPKSPASGGDKYF